MNPGPVLLFLKAALLLGLVGGCVPPTEAPAPPGRELPARSSALPLGLSLFTPVPEDGPLTRERIELGRELFFEPMLSRDGSVTCASCHRPELGFSDTLRLSPGVEGRTGTRTTPTLVNRAYGSSFFWNGRAATLEETVLEALSNPVELDLTPEELERRLRGDRRYRRAFREAFPGEPVRASNAARALASFVRSLRSGDAPVDRYGAGHRQALSDRAAAGQGVFLRRGNCAVCHFGPNLTDERFHNTGMALLSGDPGRFAVTRDEADRGRFKTPTLREIGRTGPYMHDGSLATLEEVIDFYDRGGEPHPNLDPEIRPLGLTEKEKEQLLAFLHALSGRVVDG